MRYPAVKRSLDPMRQADGLIRIGTFQYGIAFELADPTGVLWRLLQLLDGSRTATAAIDQLLSEHPGVERESVERALETLAQAGVFEDAHQAPAEIGAEELDRVSRSVEYLSWVDTTPRTSRWDTQLLLKQARVVVLGLGGAGSSAAMSLAASGIGQLVVVDCDEVCSSNLNRQFLYREHDVGEAKAEAAARALRAMNRFVDVQAHNLRIDSKEAIVELVRGASAFVLSADSPRGLIMRWANAAALETGVPWVLSGYAGPMTVVGTYVPHVTACTECEVLAAHERREQHAELAWTRPDNQHLFDSPPINAVMAPTAAIPGHMAALEIIYLLTGMKPVTLGKTLNQNLLAYEKVICFEHAKRADCPACGLH